MRARRRGNIMVVVAVLCMIAFVGISSMDYLTRSDMSSTATMVRELYGTYLAEAVAAQVEARVNARPFEQRFWELANQAKGTPGAPYTFGKTTNDLKITMDGVPDSDWDYVGVIKDLNAGLQEYRLYVEVSYQSAHFTFSWDKRCDESLLSGLNRDASRLDKQIDETAPPVDPKDPNDPTGNMLNSIKDASKVPASDQVQLDYQTLLKKLQSDTQMFQGSTEIPAKPSEAPLPPPAPTYDPSAPPSPPSNKNNSNSNSNSNNSNNANNSNNPPSNNNNSI